MNTIDVARIAHEINKAYCEGIGDKSQVSWDEAPDWQKESAINGVKFHFENPDARASSSHDNWLAEKAGDGWVYGEVKDPEKKEHPCMVAFPDLPVEQQAKDHIFKAVCKSLSAHCIDCTESA